MNFNYKESPSGYDMLSIKTDQHIDIEILFDKQEPDQVYIDGLDYSVLDDTLHGLFVVIDQKFVPVTDLIYEASQAYGPIIEEIRKEQRAEDAMIRELSSPYLTGRV